MQVVEMRIEHYDEVCRLWADCKGIGLDAEVDTREHTQMYLLRNPGLSFVALEGGKVVAAVLCGHDGRRGYMHHLAVAEQYRGKGIGKTLVEKAVAKLQQLGIRKCNSFVFSDNEQGQAFWKCVGFSPRGDLKVASKELVL